MKLNYAIFRSNPINTIRDLANIGAHNKREKSSYKSNPNIDINKSNDNIEIKPLTEKYVKGFYNLVEPYQKEHNERMKTMRKDRVKIFREMIDKSKSVVADELIFTATHKFFNNMNREEIIKWANICMDFVYNDLGYTKEQVLHATVHMDEKTPHIHCVVVPLIKKYDKRTNTNRYTISKKQYIKDNDHLSSLQDKYYERLKSAGYDLERGIRNGGNVNIPIKEYKKITKKLEREVNIYNNRLNKVLDDFNNNIKTSKNILFDNNHILLNKETLNNMNNVIEEVEEIMKVQPKLDVVFNEVNSFTKNYNMLNRQNKEYEKEIEALEYKNSKILEENITLKQRLNRLFNVIKKVFKKLLLRGNDYTKDITCESVKDLYDDKEFDKKDIIDISRGTLKQDELFDYADIPDYYKSNRIRDLQYSKIEDKKETDRFEL